VETIVALAEEKSFVHRIFNYFALIMSSLLKANIYYIKYWV